MRDGERGGSGNGTGSGAGDGEESETGNLVAATVGLQKALVGDEEGGRGGEEYDET